MQFKDYYKILGVSKDASQDEIKRAYRKLARKYHPDVSKEADAEDQFKDVGEAYEALKDSERRAAYDQLRAGGFRQGQEFRPPPGWQGGAGGGFSDDMGGFSDFFESVFGRGGGFSSQGFGGHPGGGFRDAGGQVRRRGRDLSARAVVDLQTAFSGGETRLRMPDGRTLKVKIPAGVSEGKKIRLAGQGEPGLGGGPAGNLILEIEIRPHPQFRLDGRDVETDLNIAPWEAAFGGKVNAPTLGGAVDLHIPEGSRSGTRLRLRGRGLPGQSPGDQYVVLQIQNPPLDTPESRALYEKMASELNFDPRGA